MVRIDSECKVDLVKYQSENFVLTTQARLDSTVWSSTINYHWRYSLITYKCIQEAITEDNDGRFVFTFIFFFRKGHCPFERHWSTKILQIIHSCSSLHSFTYIIIFIIIKYNSQYHFHVTQYAREISIFSYKLQNKLLL